jgi:hypothetical protein
MHRKTYSAAIELLEDRVAPATIIHAGGSLAISNPDGNLLVETTGTPGQINVTDASGTETFEGIMAKIAITGRSAGVAADLISFAANVSPFQGSLVIDAGFGNDTVNLSGTINRSVVIKPGQGSDTIVLNNADVSVGQSFTVTDTSGGSLLFDMNDRDLSIGASLTLTGVTTFDMGVANLLDVAKTMKLTQLTGLVPTTVLLTGAVDIAGDLIINSGHANDTLNLSGTIGKNVVINTGFGSDTITLTNTAVSVGRSFTVKDPGGESLMFDMNDRTLTIGGSLSLSGITDFDMGVGNTLDVAGAMSMTVDPFAAGLTAQFNGFETAVDGDLKVSGGNANDVFSISSRLSVGGNLLSKLGQGDNTFVLTPASGGTGLARSFSHSGLDGVDVVVLGASSVITGKASLLLGNGINTFVDSAGSAYGSDLTVVSGFNTTTSVITGQITGNLSVTYASGGAGNTTVFTGSIGADKKLTYRSGHGGTLEVLTLAPAVAATVTVDVKFGNGDATFTLGPNLTLGGKVTGQGGTYTFNPNTAVLLPSLQLINFP